MGDIMETKFDMSRIEEIALEKWWKDHKDICKHKKKKKMRHLTYSFTPTGIGDVIVVTCSCGKSIDVTDVESW